jgi:hypothetical protein
LQAERAIKQANISPQASQNMDGVFMIVGTPSTIEKN